MDRGIVELHVIIHAVLALFTFDIKILGANFNLQAAPYFLLDLAHFRTVFIVHVLVHIQIPSQSIFTLTFSTQSLNQTPYYSYFAHNITRVPSFSKGPYLNLSFVIHSA